MANQLRQTAFRLTDARLAKLDRIAASLPKSVHGMPATRTDALNHLIDRGEQTMTTTTKPAYWMTVAGSDIKGHWEPCKSDTIDGAMREAGKRFGGGYAHHRILVASGDDVTEERVVLRSRAMARGSHWDRGV